MTWRDRRYIERLGIRHPILQAPMAGANDWRLAVEVSRAGGLGSIPCAMLSAESIRDQVHSFRAACAGPVHLNFFCHRAPQVDAEHVRYWCGVLQPFFAELGVDSSAVEITDTRRPFDQKICDLLLELKPEIVSFHFGLPAVDQVRALQDAGCFIQASATQVEEARWLAARGVDAVIAQGWEAGGHRAVFLQHSVAEQMASQVGLMALLPQVLDAVDVPVIAAGGIGDARGIVAALAMGAAAVQMGTAYLFCPEATISPLYRGALERAQDRDTRVTNLMTGRPARGLCTAFVDELGPIHAQVLPFPLAAAALLPLRLKAEAQGSRNFSAFWAGQGVGLGRSMPAFALTKLLAEESSARMGTT